VVECHMCNSAECVPKDRDDRNSEMNPHPGLTKLRQALQKDFDNMTVDHARHLC